MTLRIMKYTPVIGLEVHVELKTKSKMFCSCSADYFGHKPNTHCCPVCLGLPGALPVPNKKAIEWCIMIGLALNCDIPLESKFDRKNYFYPDLPKGYQISQYDEPFAINGYVILNAVKDPMKKGKDSSPTAQNDKEKRIRIRRVHMEEDTGKLIHEGNSSLIDFNRSGVPLVEIVTEPDFQTSIEVKEYLQKLQQIVRYLNVSNADMEKGEMRLEPNISLQSEEEKEKTQLPKYKVEVKNINSFKFVERAIEVELARQRQILESGKIPTQETRGWHEGKQTTVSQRVKEEANDYRYFPEPDIPPLHWKQTEIDSLKKRLPELPDQKIEKFINFGLNPYSAQISTATVARAEFMENALKYSQELNIDPRGSANYILNRRINDIENLSPLQVVKEYKNQTVYTQVDESKLTEVIDRVLIENPKAVADYKKGKESVIMFLVGQVMKNFKEKIDAKMVKEKIEKQINSN